MDAKEFTRRLSSVPEVDPDEIDLRMLAEADTLNDDSVVPLDEFNRQLDEYISDLVIRIPRSLHRALQESAESEGIDLNQYVLYKLAK